jgi:DNA-nicking Smr family endonuclease
MKQYHYHRPPRTVPGTAEEIMDFLAEHGTRDKDAHAPVLAKRSRTRAEKKKGGILRITLDLHGLTSDDASRRVRFTVDSCRSRGIKELCIIHGRGIHSGPNEGPVLKNLVRGLLENELAMGVTRFRDGLPREGGEGVTIAYLA